MIYNLSSNFDQQQFKSRCNALYRQGKTVELKEKRHKRTLSQNSYLHLLLSFFAIETGNKTEFVKREYFKKLCNSELFAISIDDPYLGRTTDFKSSADLNTEEMSTAIERFRNWSSEVAGIYLPEPNEEDAINHIHNEIEKNKRFI